MGDKLPTVQPTWFPPVPDVKRGEVEVAKRTAFEVMNAKIVESLLARVPSKPHRLTQHECIDWLRCAEVVVLDGLTDADRTAFGKASMQVDELLKRALSGELPEARPVPNRHWRKRERRAG